MEHYTPDYLLMAFWLIVFGTVFAICGIAETLQDRRRKHGNL